jgi:Arc/MetJ family transcription regulator
MQTNILINHELVAEAMRLANAKTDAEAVEIALHRYIESERIRSVRELFGDGVDPSYDYQQARTDRHPLPFSETNP